MKKYKCVFLIITVYILDLISKLIVTSNLKINGSVTIIKNFFKITYIKNKGAAFGMLQGKTILLIAITLLIFIFLIKEIVKRGNSKLIDFSLSLIIGGLLSNLSDRVFLGYVRDFLDFRIFSYEFAIFNLGDITIVTGSILFFIGALLEERHAVNSR